MRVPRFTSDRTKRVSPRYTSDGQYSTSTFVYLPAFEGCNTFIEIDSKTYASRPVGRSSMGFGADHHSCRRDSREFFSRRRTTAAKKYKIPVGYSLKNWDPEEKPILLLGSVFDATSLGWWIYEWTAYCHGPDMPISHMAGDLWLLLIQLAGKMKRAEEGVHRERSAENQVIIEEFIDAGERLNDRLDTLLEKCEVSMLKVSRETAGVEFVDTLFDRERELERTERLMQGIRLFNQRFDVNCEDILRRSLQRRRR